MQAFPVPVQRMLQEIQNVIREGKGNFKKASFIAKVVAGVLTFCSLILNIVDGIAGWVGVLMLSIVLVLVSCFLLLTALEFEEQRGYEASDMQRITNAIYLFEIMLHGAMAFELLFFLGSYFVTLLILGILAYNVRFRPVKKADATSLWKDIRPIVRDCKIKMAYSSALFLIVMGAMLWSVLS